METDWEDLMFGLKQAAPIPLRPVADVIPIDGDADKRRYLALLQRECVKLANTTSGRNDQLNTSAFDMAKFIAAGHLTRQEVEDALMDAGRSASALGDHPFTDAEMRATLKSALGSVKVQPKTLPSRATPGTVIEVSADELGGADNEDQEKQSKQHIWGGHEPIDAAAYLFDQEDTTTALWGRGESILWAEGEALMIAGGMGLGKTTLAGQIIRAQLGLEPDVLGLPVEPAERILYLAMDRPRQIRRSMLRQFDMTERDTITGRLLIRPGPPVADIAMRPSLLAEMAQECGATVIYVDSLKDAAIGLSSDEVGAAYNRARQFALAQGVQVCELHHLIKRNPMGGAPNSVADVYGSNWLTAGAGSVVMITGDPGDPIVEFRHVKQPHDEVGPWRLLHNTVAGQFTVDHEVDLLALAAVTGPEGLTAQGAAAAIFEREKPTRAQVEKARRRLDKLVAAGALVRIEGMRGGVDGGLSANYFIPE